MALAEVVAAAPDSVHHTGEQLRALGGSFKGEMPQEKHASEDKAGDTEQLKRIDGAVDAGFNIPVLATYDGGMGCDARHLYNGMLSENGHSMYYAPGYEFPQQSSYCSQPQGPYISNMASGGNGYCGAQYGAYYQQVSPALMQYYPVEQEVSKPGSKKPSSKDASQNTKSKPGAQGKLGYQGGYKNSLQSDSPPNHWGPYPAAANGGFYGAAMGYDCYVPQQWQSSARGFQPIPAPQNIGGHGSCVPPLTGGGPGRYQNFPRVHSAPTMSGRVLKGCSVKGGSTGSNWRAKEVTKTQGKGEGAPANNGLIEACIEQTQKLSVKPRVFPGVQDSGDMLDQPYPMYENQSSSVNRADYNKDEFQISYEVAKFFIIKSYSEDDVHKSIKYSVWSSTPNGNKRLDEAYRKAQEKSESSSVLCPVFFFFSVNCSGQFCGVAEMVGSVDFGKNMDFWLQGKWNGCLPVKWHIIKDVPNGHFRHIILSNNDNKPVTHSRDTQEVHFHQGLEMLKIFKFFPTRTSLLDDFAFYDGRQRVLQERKSRQQLRQQVVKQIKERAPEKTSSVSDVPLDPVKENGRPVKLAERINNGVDLCLNQGKENGRPDEAESEKLNVDRIHLKTTELKVDGRAEPNVPVESCLKDRDMPHAESVSTVQEDKASKPKASKEVCNGKETSNKSEVVENGDDKNSKPKVVNTDTTASSGKEDASRMVINYKKALLEGIQGKVITLDQTIGA